MRQPCVLLIVKQSIPDVGGLSSLETWDNLFIVAQLQRHLSGCYRLSDDGSYFDRLEDRPWHPHGGIKVFVLDPIEGGNMFQAGMLGIHLDKIKGNDQDLRKFNNADPLSFVIHDIESLGIEAGERLNVGVRWVGEIGHMPLPAFSFTHVALQTV